MRGDWSFGSIAPGETEIEGFTVLAREIPHKGGRTFGYRISDGHSTLTYMPDHRPTAFGPGPDGFGEYHEAALELAGDSDLLIHDAQLLREELAAEGRFGHSCGEYAVGLARRAGLPGGACSSITAPTGPTRLSTSWQSVSPRDPEVTLASRAPC